MPERLTFSLLSLDVMYRNGDRPPFNNGKVATESKRISPVLISRSAILERSQGSMMDRRKIYWIRIATVDPKFGGTSRIHPTLPTTLLFSPFSFPLSFPYIVVCSANTEIHESNHHGPFSSHPLCHAP
jgi:hypothetical protein